jgi:hypothetical protein
MKNADNNKSTPESTPNSLFAPTPVPTPSHSPRILHAYSQSLSGVKKPLPQITSNVQGQNMTNINAIFLLKQTLPNCIFK